MPNNKLSIILLSYNSEHRIFNVFDTVSELLQKEKIDFEFIIIDDASNDKSYEISEQLERDHPNVVRAFQLSRNTTTSNSIFAGLSICRGVCAMAIPDDEQQPYETIIDLYRIWQSGAKIIIPHRIGRSDSFFSHLSSKIFYYLINLFSNIKYPPGGADLFFIDREIIDIIKNKISKINTYIIPELLRLGYDPVYYSYKRPKGSNSNSRWTFNKRINLGINIFLASSSSPIRFISITGILLFLFSIAIIFFYIYAKLIGYITIPGWTLLVIFISFFSGLILLSLGIIAEYIWRIYEEVKNRPGFIIKKPNNNVHKNTHN